MKNLKSKLISVLLILVVAGLIYALGAGNPLVIAIQYATCQIA
jgi:hypothetical protein